MAEGYALDILVRRPRWELPRGKWEQLTTATKDDRFTDLGGSTYIRLRGPDGLECYYLGSTIFGLAAKLKDKEKRHQIGRKELAQTYLMVSWAVYGMAGYLCQKPAIAIIGIAFFSLANARHVVQKANPKDDYQNFDRVITFSLSPEKYQEAKICWRIIIN